MLRTELEHCNEGLSRRFTTYSNKLLISESPLQVIPSLAIKIGLNEALVLQQIHYWISNPLNQNIRDDRSWVYNTYDDWKKQFPFWSYNTIKRTFASLESSKLLISCTSYNKSHVNRTKWYTINYETLDSLVIGTSAHFELLQEPKMSRPSAQNELLQEPKMSSCTITEITTEITTEINPLLSVKKPIKKTFDAEFNEFWAINPKPVDKLDARKVFNRLLNEDYGNFQKIMEGRRAQNIVIELEGTERKYIKGPAAWLRNEKFNDLVQTQEQLHEEYQRSVSKATNQPRRLSKIDQQHSLNAQLRESATRELQDVNDRRAEVAREIARRASQEGNSGREHSYESL